MLILLPHARIILQTLDKEGVEGVKKFIIDWFDVIKKVMFLTGSAKLQDLKRKISTKGKTVLKDNHEFQSFYDELKLKSDIVLSIICFVKKSRIPFINPQPT